MGDLERLLARYWDLAYAEGREGRSHDTPAGDAQETLSAIRDALTSLIAERDGLREALESIKERVETAFGAGVFEMPSPNPNGPTRWEHQQAALFSVIKTARTALSLDTNKGDDGTKPS